MGLDCLHLLRSLLPVAPLLQADEGESAIACPDIAQKAETQNRSGVLHPRLFCQDVLHFRGNIPGSLERGGIGKLDVQVQKSLVLIRDKARRQFSAEKETRGAEGSQKNKH